MYIYCIYVYHTANVFFLKNLTSDNFFGRSFQEKAETVAADSNLREGWREALQRVPRQNCEPGIPMAL